MNDIRKRKVKQRKQYDCGLCCLAMFLDEDYDYLKDEYFSDYNLSREGISDGVQNMIIEKETGKKVCKNKKCFPHFDGIITVESKNAIGWHAVFWDSQLQTVIDPTNKKNKYLEISKRDIDFDSYSHVH